MELQLNILKTPNGVTPADARKVFGADGGRIGRAADNDWILPDPERYVSSHHCSIVFDGGQFFIEDTSTNGTYLNKSHEPVGDKREPLSDGSRLTLGDYEIEAMVVAGNHQDLQGNAALDGPFSDVPAMSAHDEAVASVSVNMDIPQKDEPLWHDPIYANAVDHEQKLFANEEEVDPLKLLDNPGQSEDPAPSFDMSMFTSQVDHAPISEQAFAPPKVQSSAAIPEDWDQTDLSFFTKDSERTGFGPGSNPLQQSAGAAVIPRPSVAPRRRQGGGDVLMSERPRQRNRGRMQQANEMASSGGMPPESVSGAAAHLAHTVASRSPGAGAQAAHPDLLAALGANVTELTMAQQAQVNEMAGAVIREAIDGIIQVLRSRNTIKNELRLAVTTMQPVDNNPLKFAANVDDAIEHLFLRQGKAYLSPVDAVRESFDSIMDHQVAVLAGMRAAIQQLVARFNPNSLEKSFDMHAGKALFSGGRKTRYWDAYREFYHSQVEDWDTSFQQLFGEEFIKAYESQLSKLNTARRNQ